MVFLKDGVKVPAGGMAELKPGGMHLMLMKIKNPLKEEDRIPVKLEFASANTLDTYLAVQPLDGISHSHH